MLTLVSCNMTIEDNNAAYDIFIVAGQSNTHHGLGLNYEIDQPDPNIFQLGRYSLYNHVIIPAKEPLQHHTSDPDKIGFALTFTKLYNKELNSEKKPILIIPCGYGGTSLKEDWTLDGFLYNDMIERTQFILKKFPNSKLKALLWHQGESDIGTANHQELLDQFLNKTREDFNFNLPIIVGGVVPKWARQSEFSAKVQEIIKDTPNRLENVEYADPEIPFEIVRTKKPEDVIHYDAPGQRELGKRFFNAYINLIH